MLSSSSKTDLTLAQLEAVARIWPLKAERLLPLGVYLPKTAKSSPFAW
jgi:hypothetical protein